MRVVGKSGTVLPSALFLDTMVHEYIVALHPADIELGRGEPEINVALAVYELHRRVDSGVWEYRYKGIRIN